MSQVEYPVKAPFLAVFIYKKQGLEYSFKT